MSTENFTEQAEISRFDYFARVVSFVSLAFTAFACVFVFQAWQRGGWWDFYYVWPLMLGFPAQVLIYIFGVVVPLGALAWRKRLRMSRGGWLLIGASAAGIGGEFLALWLVPSRGAC